MKKPHRFNSLVKFVKKEKGQEEDSAMAQKQSPQAINVPDIQPAKEAELVVSKRKALQSKRARPLYE